MLCAKVYYTIWITFNYVLKDVWLKMFHRTETTKISWANIVNESGWIVFFAQSHGDKNTLNS